MLLIVCQLEVFNASILVIVDALKAYPFLRPFFPAGPRRLGLPFCLFCLVQLHLGCFEQSTLLLDLL